jgi:hypothetical protein
VGMDRKAIRTDDQRLERSRLIESNRQKRAENNEKTLETINKQLMVCLFYKTFLSMFFSLLDST